MKKLLVLGALVALFTFTGVKCQKEEKFDINKIPVEKVKVGDIEIAYKTMGTGEPMILVMGLTGTMDAWNPKVLENLSKNYQVTIFDNRGMGLTTSTGKDYTMETLADDTAGLMDALAINKAYVLGWSMGTYVSEELVLKYPDKVNKLILYAGDCGTPGIVFAPTKEVMDDLMDDSGTEKEQGQKKMKLLFPDKWLADHTDIFEYFPKITEETTPENMTLQFSASDGWKGTCDRIQNIKTPTLLVTGTDDILTPPANSQYLSQKISDSWLVRFPDSGHGMMYQYPDNFVNVVTNFINNSK